MNRGYFMSINNELYHYGVKGMKWGVWNEETKARYSGSSRRSRRNYFYNSSKSSARSFANRFYKRRINSEDTNVEIGKRHVDTVLDKNTGLYRIQAVDYFEKYPFYATYKQHDIDAYAGLLSKNLVKRAKDAAREAEDKAAASGSEEDKKTAEKLREDSERVDVYQLRIANKQKLQIPSEDNAGRIVGNLLKDEEFHNNLRASIEDCKTKMLRPSQQILFNEALKSMNKKASKLTPADKRYIYKALNLSLTYHNNDQIAVQNKFYNAMKKEGYSALLDLNDRTYSSYHAKSPVIVFDTDKVYLQSATKMDPKKIDSLYRRYNTERIVKEIPEHIVGTIAKYGELKADKAASEVESTTMRYLGVTQNEKEEK